jgi:hypothetical protein
VSLWNPHAKATHTNKRQSTGRRNSPTEKKTKEKKLRLEKQNKNRGHKSDTSWHSSGRDTASGRGVITRIYNNVTDLYFRPENSLQGRYFCQSSPKCDLSFLPNIKRSAFCASLWLCIEKAKFNHSQLAPWNIQSFVSSS